MPEPLVENLAPPTFLPAPAVLAERLNAAGRQLAVEHGTAAYDAIGPRLEEAATGYIVRALRALGLPLQVGVEFTFAATAANGSSSERPSIGRAFATPADYRRRPRAASAVRRPGRPGSRSRPRR